MFGVLSYHHVWLFLHVDIFVNGGFVACFKIATRPLPFLLANHCPASPPSMSREAPVHDVKREELEEIYDFALSLGRRAGQILLDGVEKRCGEESGRGQGQEEKDSAVDIVTQADLGASFCASTTKFASELSGMGMCS